jgi:hypothetical protein
LQLLRATLAFLRAQQRLLLHLLRPAIHGGAENCSCIFCMPAILGGAAKLLPAFAKKTPHRCGVSCARLRAT